MALTQLCQYRFHGQKCYRVAHRWIKQSYPGWADHGENSRTIAVCDAHSNIEGKTADLGPVEVTKRGES